MQRRTLLVAITAGPLVGCTVTKPETAGDPVAQRREIDAGVTRALDDLYQQVRGSRELVGRAQGVLVFPNLVSAGLGIGGSYGRGALRVRGGTAGYYSMAGGAIGIIAGAQSRAVFFLFMTPEALQKFEASNGWTAGVDASVAVIDAGADAQVNTNTIQQPVVGYVLTNKGLMANLSFEGTKITRLQI
jgi:lipid-binding SYLF domain-containing protein